jgi:serine/threonine protein kinase
MTYVAAFQSIHPSISYFILHSTMLSTKQLATLHNYTVDHVIGEGSYGKVYTAEEISTQTRYAIKVLPRTFSTQIQSEINILSSLSHRSCLHLHEVLCDDVAYYLVTDHVSNGTLLQHINHSNTFTEHEARQIFTQLFDGVRYLHEVRQVAHLDLKLENVMIDSKSEIKIVDFGQSQTFDALSTMRCGLHCGSLPYSAPEIVSGRRVTPSADIWSMGVILYALVTGTFPFCEVDKTLLTAQILFDEVAFPPEVSDEFRNLVLKMLEKDHEKRITLTEIGIHKWMKMKTINDSIRQEFSLPRLDFLHPSLPGGKLRLITLKQSKKLQQIEQGLPRKMNECRMRCNGPISFLMKPMRRHSG